MNPHLQHWQIPSRPHQDPPNVVEWIIFKIMARIVVPLARFYTRMDTERQIRALKSVGSRPHINGPVKIISPENVIFGKDVNINPGLYAQGTGGIIFGDHIHFGQNVRILTLNHNYTNTECLPYDKTRVARPTIVGDCVWVGDNVCIVPGVTIGEGAIIGMGATVTRDVPSLAIVGGCPAKIIKMRDAEMYWKLKRDGRFLNWPYTIEQETIHDR
jgi:acetyltransferase-like isoleucine patch superfamily enzyme